MTMMRNQTFHVYESHEPKLHEYHGIVNANGSVNQGCSGVTVARTGAGAYTLTLKDTYGITTTDLTNASMALNANGTGVTRTAMGLVTPISPTFTSTPPLNYATISEPLINGSGFLVFTVNIAQAASSGDAQALADGIFSFKIIMSTLSTVTRF